MALKIITPPTKEPVSLQQAKNHLRVDFTDDDDLISSLISTAREYCEAQTHKALAPTIFEYTLDAFPFGAPIRIPRPPLVSVDSINYKDKDGTETIMPSDSYIADVDDEPGKLVPIDGQWPSFDPYPVNAVRIRYTAGYDESTLPKSIQQAMLILVAHWYENREAIVNAGKTVNQLPFAVESLLWPQKVWLT